jgi:hypothetical protein
VPGRSDREIRRPGGVSGGTMGYVSTIIIIT